MRFQLHPPMLGLSTSVPVALHRDLPPTALFPWGYHPDEVQPARLGAWVELRLSPLKRGFPALRRRVGTTPASQENRLRHGWVPAVVGRRAKGSIAGS
jgi:hypothetical protein